MEVCLLIYDNSGQTSVLVVTGACCGMTECDHRRVKHSKYRRIKLANKGKRGSEAAWLCTEPCHREMGTLPTSGNDADKGGVKM